MSEENNNKDKPTRREFIHIATTTVGAVGAGCSSSISYSNES